MSVSSTALIDTDIVKSILNIQDDSKDAIIEMLIDGVSTEIQRFIDRELRVNTYTAAKFDGSGLNTLQLPVWPITANPTNVTADGESMTDGTDFATYQDTGVLRVKDETLVWPRGVQNVVLTYTAGYSLATMPNDLKMAAVIQVAHEYQLFLNRAWGVTSKGMSGQSTSYETEGLLKKVEKLIEPYRRRGV